MVGISFIQYTKIKFDLTNGILESEVIKTFPVLIVYRQASKYIPMELPAHKDASAITLKSNCKDITSQILECIKAFVKQAVDTILHNNVLELAIRLFKDTIYLDKHDGKALENPKK